VLNPIIQQSRIKQHMSQQLGRWSESEADYEMIKMKNELNQLRE
jgi:hypothetical protein